MSGFKIEKYADWGTGEPWVARIIIGLKDLTFAVPAFGSTRDAFMIEMGDVFESLGKAFEDLRMLRHLTAQKDASVIPLVGTYESLYSHLWRAYKGRFQKAMKTLGLDIGFLFRPDGKFEAGAAKLLTTQPELGDLVDLMRRDRAEFQHRLATYRNDYLEHQTAHPDPKMVGAFHQLSSAENMFENVWQAIEDYVALYVVVSLPPSVQLVEIPEGERDRSRPTRFTFQWHLPDA